MNGIMKSPTEKKNLIFPLNIVIELMIKIIGIDVCDF